MKQKFNVTGIIPRGSDASAGTPLDSICPGEVNSHGIKVLLRKTLGTRHPARQVMPVEGLS